MYWYSPGSMGILMGMGSLTASSPSCVANVACATTFSLKSKIVTESPTMSQPLSQAANMTSDAVSPTYSFSGMPSMSNATSWPSPLKLAGIFSSFRPLTSRPPLLFSAMSATSSFRCSRFTFGRVPQFAPVRSVGQPLFYCETPKVDGAGGMPLSRICARSSSPSTATPSSRALASFEPAASPATT